MTPHSPAPWHWGPDASDGDYALIDARGHNVANAKNAGDDIYVRNEADKRLIAAAPELLEALKAVCGAGRDGFAFIPGTAYELLRRLEAQP